MIWLGIESSCDETACAILRDDPLEILSNPLYSQIQAHALYGGVVPEVAARAHLEKITTICQEAISEAKISLSDIDAIALVPDGEGEDCDNYSDVLFDDDES